MLTVVYRKKAMYIVHRTPEMVACSPVMTVR